MKRWLVQWGIRVVVYVGAYAIIAAVANRPAFPSLYKLASALLAVASTTFLSDLSGTLLRWFIVFVLGTVSGILGGIFIGYFVPLHRALRFEIDFFRSLPATLLITFILAAFGDGHFQRSLPALYITFFTVLFYVAKHVSILDRQRVNHLLSLGAGWKFVIQKCIFYELLPAIMVATRQAISLSFLVAVSIELIVGPYNNWGLGRAFYDWQFYSKFAEIIAGLILVGVIGYLLNVAMQRLHRRLVFWNPSTE